MTKKAALKRASLSRPARALSPIRHEGAAVPHVPVSPCTERLFEEARKAFYANGDTLNSLVENVVDSLADGSEEQGQMREFLQLLLETDPSLGEEILAGVSERK